MATGVGLPNLTTEQATDLWMALFTESCANPDTKCKAAANALLVEVEQRYPAVVPPTRGTPASRWSWLLNTPNWRPA